METASSINSSKIDFKSDQFTNQSGYIASKPRLHVNTYLRTLQGF